VGWRGTHIGLSEHDLGGMEDPKLTTEGSGAGRKISNWEGDTKGGEIERGCI